MWIPELTPTAKPLYVRLTDAIVRDIALGRLQPGERLPPQRELAYRLSMSVGAVTRAYADAQRAGLIESHVGRGTVVAAPAAADGPVDFSRNLPPLAPAEQALAAGLAQMARRRDLLQHLDYPRGGGAEAPRHAAALWLQRVANFESVTPERIVLCAGAQQGAAVGLAAVCAPGEPVIAEALTFAGIKSIAANARYVLHPAALDAEGLTPDGLEAAAKASGARAAYVQPVQNPTARVMGLERRRGIVATARRLRLTLVEDDLYAAYASSLGLPPLAELAPERVIYVGGLSKSLAPGLRTGFIVPPQGDIYDGVLAALRAVAFGPPALTALIATQWIEDGTAFRILREVCAELSARAALARRLLGPAVEATPMDGPTHLWLPMDELAAEQTAGRALRAGAALTAPRTPCLEGVAPSGLRLCIGGPRRRDDLERGLMAVRASLTQERDDARDAV
jgi:DNA-binding transcriptional MocR family regulator